MTWKCPKCGREFSKQNQDHYCVKPKSMDNCYPICPIPEAKAAQTAIWSAILDEE